MGELTGGTVTFLFTDIEGSTRLLRALGDRYPAVLLRQRALIGDAAAAVGGHAFGNEGDAVFLAFHDPASALRAAADAQRALAAEPWPEDGPVRVRMGIHTGEAAMLGDDYVGLSLHETARVAAAGHGGQVLVSSATAGLARRELPEGLGLRDLGDHRLKDLTGPQRLYQLTGPGLPDGFPVLRSLEGRPHNLPAQLTSFVGREQLAQAVDLLGRTRLLTLTGPGGTGKTRLALQVAAESLEAFPDGAWFVPLETVTDPALVPSEILQAMRLQPAANQAPLDRLLEQLRDRSMLLVLDNLEQVVSVGPLVVRLLREAAALKVLATSRIPLHVSGEQELPVPPLGLPDDADPGAAEAVRLFVERAMAVRPGFTLTPEAAPVVARIVRRLDGLPLAIELAAARVRNLSPDAIEARLGASLGLLTGGARDLPERQRTLRGAIDWSHDLLDEPERRLYARLGVFAGGIDLDLVEPVCGTADELGIDPLDGLESLADKSLLRPVPGAGTPRYAMLVTIREHALERLTAAGELDVRRERHVAAMVQLAETAAPHLTGTDAKAWLDRIALEHDNLRAALDVAVERGDATSAERIAAAIWRFWQIRGHLHEAQERLERTLTMPGADATPPSVLANALIAAGSVAYWRGDATGMRRWYGAAVTAAERCGDPRTLADALYNLGFSPDDEPGGAEQPVLVFALRRPEFERALGLYRELGDRQGIARSAWALGLGELYSDQLDAARVHNLEARDLAHEAGDRFYEAWAIWDLALLDLVAADFPAARAGLRTALGMFEAMGDQSGPVLVLQGVALLARLSGDEERHWLLRGAVERLRQETGVDLVRQRLDALRWVYLERPPDATLQAAWDTGLALPDADVWAIAGAMVAGSG
ncbi:MAG: AAA family ATPase [Chloroflexota bacterium]